MMKKMGILMWKIVTSFFKGLPNQFARLRDKQHQILRSDN